MIPMTGRHVWGQGIFGPELLHLIMIGRLAPRVKRQNRFALCPGAQIAM